MPRRVGLLAVAVTSIVVTSAAIAATPRAEGVTTTRFGQSDVSAYLRQPRNLTTVPAINRNVDARLTTEALYPRVADPEALAAISRLVVRGRPTAFSLPYWNSGDHGFWHPRYLPSEAGTPVESDLYRDVTFEVVEVLGEALPGSWSAETITFTVVGGQAVVTVTSDSARLDPTFLPPGKFLWTSPPETDLEIGKEYVLFLDYQRFSGLYGEKYGYEVRLLPANLLFYAFRVDGSDSRNVFNDGDLDFREFNPTVQQLRDTASSSRLGSWASTEMPDGKIHAQPADHVREPAEGSAPPPAPEVVPDDVSLDKP